MSPSGQTPGTNLGYKNFNGENELMKMTNNLTEAEMEELLKNGLEKPISIKATDLKGGDHWQVDLVAEDFNGLNTMKKHKIVYKILAEQLANETIHALVINANGSKTD